MDLYSHASGKIEGTLQAFLSFWCHQLRTLTLSYFIFNFAIEYVQRALKSSISMVLSFSQVTVADLDYVGSVALLGDDSQAVQSALNCLAMDASKYDLYSTPDKCKILFLHWQLSVPALSIAGEVLEQRLCVGHLESCTTAGGGLADKTLQRIAKARSLKLPLISRPAITFGE
ncbi:unnamed protein product [Dicrocoelium dendriticum]|nr:unnamed protein product [Dicrocoelium dendriticum]